MIRIGLVSSVNPDNCTARVSFLDRDNVVSAELPVLVQGSFQQKQYWLPSVNELVLCAYTSTSEPDGFILGSFYSEEDQPAVKDKNKRYICFNDGTSLEYDILNHKMKLNVQGDVELTASGDITINGNIVVNGTVTSHQFIDSQP